MRQTFEFRSKKCSDLHVTPLLCNSDHLAFFHPLIFLSDLVSTYLCRHGIPEIRIAPGGPHSRYASKRRLSATSGRPHASLLAGIVPAGASISRSGARRRGRQDARQTELEVRVRIAGQRTARSVAGVAQDALHCAVAQLEVAVGQGRLFRRAQGRVCEVRVEVLPASGRL